MSNKELVIEAVRDLPDEVTLDDIAERIATLAAIRRGEEAADAGQWITHEDLKRRVARQDLPCRNESLEAAME